MLRLLSKPLFRAPIAALLTIRPEHVSATFTIYPRGSSVTGRASARYIIRGSTGYYGGTLTIVKGTGIYRHASGSNIGISGTINRQSFALSVKSSRLDQLLARPWRAKRESDV